MNLVSWILLGVLVLLAFLALRAYHKDGKCGSCRDAGAAARAVRKSRKRTAAAVKSEFGEQILQTSGKGFFPDVCCCLPLEIS